MNLAEGRTITFLYTDDLPRLSRFYEGVLGLELVIDQGACRILRASATALVGLCDLPHRPRGTDGVMLTFAVADVDAAHAALLARGVAFEGPVATSMAGTVRSAFFRDPEGYRLALKSGNFGGEDFFLRAIGMAA